MSDSLQFDDATSSALGFTEMLDWLADLAVTEPGRQQLLTLRPLRVRADIEEAFDGVDELRRFREGLGRLVPPGLPDPADSVRLLDSGDRGLDPLALRALAGFLTGAGRVAGRAEDLPPEQWPVLRGILDRMPLDLLPLSAAILRGIDGDGALSDAASSELARIRRRQRQSAARLQKMLEQWMHEPSRQPHLQDTFITQRNQRFVVPVKTDASGHVAGIVHGHSSTGQTRFIEPLETVELNNERVELRDAEREEERRILQEWQSGLLEHRDSIHRNVERIALLDSLEARAEFSERYQGCRPKFSDEGGLAVERLRHPLLIRHLQDDGREVVPLQLFLAAEQPLLVISGPNAGGKTIVLKSLGLAVLMAQSGIPPLAESVSLPLFDQVFADIGDHQSIDSDLSTYSGHVQALRTVVTRAAPRSLLLIDEIGSGTDPAEGAALAQAFLERYLSAGFVTIATTHHGPLKRWAYLEPRIDSAAMEFDEANQRPTYQLLPGAAGSSAGLDVAEKLGLPAELLTRARELLGEHGVESERFMRRLREAVAEAEQGRESVRKERLQLEQRLEEAEKKARTERQESQQQAAEQLTRALEGFRKEASKQLKGLSTGAERRAAQKDYQARDARMRMEHERRQAEVGTPRDDGRPPETLTLGMLVRVHSLARVGELLTVDGDRAEVKLGRHSFKVAVADLRPAGEEGASSVKATPRKVSSGDDLGGEAFPAELMLIGERVVEALERLERHLDGATRAGLGETRIVHGHGTGRLRTAVREYLRGHPLVGKVRPGDETEGGNGATIAKLH